ncbi:MAG: Cys-tRNA(Pro) deacylase, partial [Thermocrispum sp.]
VVDGTARYWPTVYCSAGRRGLEVELSPADLITLTGATVAPIAG